MNLFRLLILFFAVTLGLFAQSQTKNILIIDREEGMLSGLPVPKFFQYRYNVYEPAKLGEDLLELSDTVILFQPYVGELDSNKTTQLVNWIREGGKLIIMAKPSELAFNRFDWLPYGYDFATNSAMQRGSGPASMATVSEYNHLTASLDVERLNQTTDAFINANVMIAKGTSWNSAVTATNVNNVSGPVLAYAKYGRGVLYYWGLGIADMKDSSEAKALFKTLLELPWNPDPLPYTNASGVEIPPPLVKISGLASQKVLLSWKSPAWLKGIRGYKVYRSTDGGKNKRLIAEVGTVNRYMDQNATDGTTYQYFVTSYDATRDSAFSESVSATPPGEVVSSEMMTLVTPDGNFTVPITAVTTTDNFDHLTGDAYGTSQKVAADPVSLATGGFYLEVKELEAGYGAGTIRFERSYNSIFKSSGETYYLGNGWRHNYLISLSPNSDGSMSLKWGDGHSDIYLKSRDEGTWVYFAPASNRVYAELSLQRGKGYRLEAKKETYLFDETTGRLTHIIDRNGNARELSYENGRLAKVSHSLSKLSLLFTYENDRLSRVCLGESPCIVYDYDDKANLIRVTGLDGAISEYAYDNAAQMTQSLSNGQLLFENEYANGQVVRQRDAAGSETRFEYRMDGETRVTDREGRIWRYRHDSLGRLISETDPNGAEIHYAYNPQGEVARRTAKDGTLQLFSYDEKGNMLYATDELGEITSYEYDAKGNRTAVTDREGRTMRMTYDGAGNLIRAEDALGNATRYAYDSAGLLMGVTDPRGFATTYAYDSFGRPVSVTNARGATIRMEYDALGRKTADIDAYGAATRYTYDVKNRIRSITDPLGNSVGFTYDLFGNLTEKTHPDGNKTLYEYDSNFHVIKKVAPDGGVSRYAYSKEGNLIRTVDPLGNTTHYTYDKLNRKVRITAADGSSSQLSYTARDRIAKSVDASGAATWLEYDATGRLNSTLAADKSRFATAYTKDGQAKEMTDALGRVKRFEYDANNRVIAVTDPLKQTAKTTYDAAGNRVETLTASGKNTRYSYNETGRITQITDASGGKTTFDFDLRGSLSKVTFPSGKWIAFEYDAANRLVGKSTQTERVGYTLDSKGNRLRIDYDQNQSHIIKRYDAQNRLIERMDAAGRTVGYRYDSAGNLTELRYSDGAVARYGYNALNRIIKVVAPDGGTTQYAYNAQGKLAAITQPDGYAVSYSYDVQSRLTERKDCKAGKCLSHYGYVLNAAGERVGENRSEPLSGFADNGQANFSYGKDNRVESGTYTLKNDADGNLIRRVKGKETLEMAYDSFDRMRAKNGTTFRYDGENLRIAKTEGGKTEHYVYDTHEGIDRLLEVYDDKGTLLRRYVHGLGLISVAEKGAVLYYHYDTRGSTVALTDASGAIKAAYAYDIFGGVTARKGSVENPFTYVGQYGVMDDGDGIFHMRSRAYDSNLMRFIQKDRILLGTVVNAQSLNRYAYVEGDPIRGIDPMGAWFMGDDVIAAGLGALIEVAKQVITDIAEGKTSSVETYVAAAVKGATKAQVLLYTANVQLAEATGTFMGDITKQGLEVAGGKKESINYTGALKAAATSALTAGIGGAESTVATGLDEALNQVKKHAVSSIKTVAPKAAEMLIPDLVVQDAENLANAQGGAMQNSDVTLQKYK